MRNIVFIIIFLILSGNLASQDHSKLLFTAFVYFDSKSPSSSPHPSKKQSAQNGPYLQIKEQSKNEGYELVFFRFSQLDHLFNRKMKDFLKANVIKFKTRECSVKKDKVIQFDCKKNQINNSRFKSLQISASPYNPESKNILVKSLTSSTLDIYVLRVELERHDKSKVNLQWVTNPSKVQTSYTESRKSLKAHLLSAKN